MVPQKTQEREAILKMVMEEFDITLKQEPWVYRGQFWTWREQWRVNLEDSRRSQKHA